VLVAEMNGAVEALFDGNRVPGLDEGGLIPGNLEAVVLVAEGEIVAHSASLGLGKKGEEIHGIGQEPVKVRRIGGLHCETPVPEGYVFLGEEVVGFVQGGDSLEPEFFDQSILRGRERALDTALGLGGIGENELDVESLESQANDGTGMLGFFLFGGFSGRSGPFELAETRRLIGIEGHRPPMASEILDQEPSVLYARFPGNEASELDSIGGIVDGLEECEPMLVSVF